MVSRSGRVFDIKLKRFLKPSEISPALRKIAARGPRSGRRPGIFDIRTKRFLSDVEIVRRRTQQLIRKGKDELKQLTPKEKLELQTLQKTLVVARVAPVTRTEVQASLAAGVRPTRKTQSLSTQRITLDSKISNINTQATNLNQRRLGLENALRQLASDDVNGAAKIRLAIEKLRKDIGDFEKRRVNVEATRKDFNRKVQVANVKAGAITLPSGKIKPEPTAFIAAAPKPFSIVPEKQRRVLAEIEAGIAFGGERLLGVAFETGQAIVKVTPEQVRKQARQSFLAPRTIGGELFGGVTVEEARKKIVPLGAPIAEISTVFLPGGIGTARRVQAALTGASAFDVGFGFLLGGGARVAKTGSQFAKLLLPTGKVSTAFRAGEKVVGKALVPAVVGAQAVLTGAELRAAAGRPEEVRRIGRETAGGFAGFLLGARAGAAFGEQFFVPVEAGLARQAALRQLPPKQQQKFKEFFEIAKQFDKQPITPKNLTLQTERLSAKEAKIVQSFLKRNPQVVLFGSAAIVPQVPKRIGRTIKPEDIDLSATDFKGIAKSIAAALRAGGVKRISLIERASGTVITKSGVKVIEVKPRERLIANIGTVRSPFELPSQAFVKTPQGITILKLSVQEKRAVIAGLLEEPGLRAKDIERFERIAKILTPEQVATARAIARREPAVARARTEAQRLLGEQAGEFLPARRKPFNFFEPKQLFEVPRGRPARRARLGGDFSFLPTGFRRTFFPFKVSRLPKAGKPSKLFFGEPSKLPPIVKSFLPPAKPSRLPPTKKIEFPPSRIPQVTLTRLPPTRRPPTVPSRLPPAQPISFLPPGIPSILPPARAPPTVPSRLPPTRPGKLPPTKPVLFPALEQEKKFISGLKKVRGFNVLVKQEPFRKKRFLRVNKKVLPRNAAIARGAFVTDQTIAQTFKIRTVNKKVKPRIVFGTLQRKFRQPKGRPNVFIERRGFAIDTIGEVNKLQVSKLLAQEKRGFFRPQRRNRKRGRRQKNFFGGFL